jgi:hypothetical protein
MEGTLISALHSWQNFTKGHGIELMFQLHNWQLPAAALPELIALGVSPDLQLQAGPYHRGEWSVLPLVSADGDPKRHWAKTGDKYYPTRFLDQAGPTYSFLSQLPGKLRRVRISRLKAGGQISWHFDDFSEKTGENIFRLHVPIVTAPENFQVLSHSIGFWDLGETWLGDYRFPHKVVNASELDRLHLIIDILPNDSMIDSVNNQVGFDWFGERRKSSSDTAKNLLVKYRSEGLD